MQISIRSIRAMSRAMCAVTLFGVGVLAPHAAEAQKVMGKFWINDAKQNPNDTQGGDWESVWTWGTYGQPWGWGGRWIWHDPKSAGTIKGFPSSVLGWHWGNGIAPITGMPVSLATSKSVVTNWTYILTDDDPANPNVLDAQYTLWIHNNNPSQGYAPPNAQIVIWLMSKGGKRPLGTAVTTTMLAGTNWTLYKEFRKWPIYTFARASDTLSVTNMNLLEFTDFLKTQKYLRASQYLSGVESGVEIVRGSGKFDTQQYSCDVN